MGNRHCSWAGLDKPYWFVKIEVWSSYRVKGA